MTDELATALKELHEVIQQEGLNPAAFKVTTDEEMLVFAVRYLKANCDHAFDPDAEPEDDPRNEIAEHDEIELCGPNGIMYITVSQKDHLESLDMIYYDEQRECYFCEGLTTLQDIREELAG